MKEQIVDSLIGTKIAYYRALKGLTQAELASKAGISTPYVSHIETGVKRPTFKLTVKVAKALGVDWKELAISPIVKKINELNISDGEKQELNLMVASIKNYLE